ncbi:Dabb family protein [Muriicola soli]|uniref:Dabb family protein n=1 Tax=Muriicola soli TaxID=2507538 RepID=A0A411EAW3_9FLAO|nr:Dabb family protein [Muriicola soli]QBA64667.1 Dabb family protein [Muriicola soli]
MKFLLGVIAFVLCLNTFNFKNSAMSKPNLPLSNELVKDSVLRHVVLLKFKAQSSEKDIKRVQESFVELKSKIPQIVSLEWGVNNSPEGLDKGYTHCFFLTFNSTEDRDSYLPNPHHKAFGEVLGPVLEDVLVVDYWTH